MDQASRNKEILKVAYQAYARGDLDAVLDHMDEDIGWYSMGPQETLRWASCCTGKCGVREFFAKLQEQVEILSFTARSFIAEDDHVIVLADVTARARGGGRPFSFDKVDVVRMRDGKIIEFREYYDTAAAAAMMEDRATATAAA